MDRHTDFEFQFDGVNTYPCTSFVRVREATSPKNYHLRQRSGLVFVGLRWLFQALVMIDFRMAFKRSLLNTDWFRTPALSVVAIIVTLS